MSEISKKEKAVQYKHNGCNCCQAVLMAYADVLNLDENTLMTLGSGFGAGMGTMQGSCGALIGAVLADNILNQRKNSSGARTILSEFNTLCGDTICSKLKGRETGIVLCSCDDCVKNAVSILEKNMKK